MKQPVKFGKYYLLERVSVGGMAEIFKAKTFGEAGFERTVAVKRILPSITEDHEFIAMFVDEAKLAVQLQHPNIAQIAELGKVGEAYFIALEFVHGKDLRTIFDRARKRGEPLPVALACYVVMQICAGLDYAHNKKDSSGRNLDLVHRDVSPQNMLLSYEGDVKLIDFGIAKAASKSSKTQAGILKGKFGYMSPEQVRGLSVDRRSDVFAAGICLYELLTMERLFVGESDFSTLEKVRNVDILPPSTYNRKIGPDLERIILRALARDPADRYANAIDVHDALQTYLASTQTRFGRRDLSAFLASTFADDIAKEAARDEEYRRFDLKRARELESVEGSFGGSNPPSSPPSRAPERSVPPGTPPPPPPGHTTGSNPRSSVPPPPPSGAMRSKSATMVGVAAAPFPPPPVAAPPPARVGPPPMPSAVAAPPPAAAAGPLDVDWDDDEQSTHIYDRADVPPPPPAPAVRLGKGTQLGTPSVVVQPSAPSPSLPAVPAPQYAGPRAQTVTLPAAPPPSLPSIPAPPSAQTQHGIPAMPQFVPAAASAPPVAASYPPAAYRPAPSMPAPSTPAAFSSPPPASSPNLRPALLGGLVALAVVGLGVAFLMPKKTGTLIISTNVPDAVVRFDGVPLPQSGHGFSFTVPDLVPHSTHHVNVEKPGFHPREESIEVQEAPTTMLELALDADAPPVIPVAAVPVPVVPTPVAVVAPPPVPVAVVAPPPVAVPTPAPIAPPPVVVHTAPHRDPAPRVSEPSHTIARPVREPAPARPGPAAAGGTGFLSISTSPASQCTVGGHTYSTPHMRIELPVGSQRVSCTNSDFGVSATFNVNITAGQETRDIRHPLQ